MSGPVRAIIGLGNPGSEYDGTRHNIGFAVIDAVAQALKIEIFPGEEEYAIGQSVEGNILLIKPLTYMNNSGIAIRDIKDRFNVFTDDLVLVVDDFHLPLGCLRFRRKGSSGGHNGLASIIWHLQSDNFPRLRCGISGTTMPAKKSEMADYVLSPFENDELPVVRKMIEHAAEAAIIASTKDIHAAIQYITKN